MIQLTDFYPQPSDLIKNEIETVKFFSQNTFIQSHVAFYNEAKRVYAQHGQGSRGFSFASYFDLFHAGMPGNWCRSQETSNVRLIVAALIEQKQDLSYGNISYALGVCRLRSKRSSILRKFHFDVATSLSRRQPHPICHIQYCGEMLNIMSNLGYRDEQLQQLHTKVREPRVFFHPMSLALLVDMALREFPDEMVHKNILRSPEWRNLIRRNEDLMWKKFFETCYQTINSNVPNRPTVSDKFYLSK